MSANCDATTKTLPCFFGRRILRYTLGVVLAIALAYSIDWTLAYIMPVFVAKFFVDRPAPSRGTFDELFLAMVVTVLIALVVSHGVTQYPLILLLLIGLLMFWAYYLFQDPRWNFFAMILMIAVLLVPYMGIIHPAAALLLGKGLMVSGIGAVVIFWLMHQILPEPIIEPDGSSAQRRDVSLSEPLRVGNALKALAISFPVIVYFYYFQASGALLTLAFIGILSLQLTSPGSIKLSIFLLLTNMVGGILAVIAYELLVVAPWFPFLLAMMTLFAWLFAQKLYLEPHKAPVYAGIFSAMLVVFGSVISGGGKEIDVSFYTRIGQIFLASIYLVLVAWLVDRHASVSGSR